MSVKRWPAQYMPQNNAGPEVATMVLATDYDKLVALGNAMAEAIERSSWRSFESDYCIVKWQGVVK